MFKTGCLRYFVLWIIVLLSDQVAYGQRVATGWYLTPGLFSTFTFGAQSTVSVSSTDASRAPVIEYKWRRSTEYGLPGVVVGRRFNGFSLDAGVSYRARRVQFAEGFTGRSYEQNVDLQAVDRYWRGQLGVAKYFGVKGDREFYVRNSFVMNKYGTKMASDTRTAGDLEGTFTYVNGYPLTIGVQPEMGFNWYCWRRAFLSFYVLGSWEMKVKGGTTPMFAGDYYIRQNGSLVAQDKYAAASGFRFGGSLVKLNFRLGHDRVERDGVVAGVSDKRKVEVYSQVVQCCISDFGTEDGDVVSLYCNGRELLTDVVLKKEPFCFDIELEEGKNDIALLSVSEGKEPPTTCKMIVTDTGGHQYLKVLKAGLGKQVVLPVYKR